MTSISMSLLTGRQIVAGLASLVLCQSVSCAEFGLVYRHSSNFTQQFLYFSTNIALVKHIRPGNEDQPTQIMFDLVRAHWGGKPELVDSSGDLIDDWLANRVTDVGFLRERKLLIVRSRLVTADGTTRPLFMVDLLSGKITRASSIDDLRTKLPATVRLELQCVEVVFDRGVAEAMATMNRKR